MNSNPENTRSTRNKKLIIGAIAGVIAAVAFFFAGFSVATTTIEPEIVKEVETKTEYKTPQSCLDYIEYSNQGFTLLAEVLGYSGASLTAVMEYDYSELSILTKKINGVNAEMDALEPKLNAAKSACANSK